MSTKTEEHEIGCAATESLGVVPCDCCVSGDWADLWCVRFETKDGQFHPVRYGEKGGHKISEAAIKTAAQLYLERNSDWLKCVDEIYRT